MNYTKKVGWGIYKGSKNLSQRVPPEGRSCIWCTWIVDSENKAIAQIHSNNDDTLKANTNLIVSAVNACISINPDNPQAVAESIKDMYEALKEIKKFANDALRGDILASEAVAASQVIEAKCYLALSKAEGK